MSEPLTLHEFARQVALALGFQWSYASEQPYDHCARITGPDGCAISLTGDGYNSADSKRLRVYGVWPESVQDAYRWDFQPREAPEISISLSRGPVAIARDIRQRFLPEYLPLWAKAVADRVRILARVEREQAARAALAEAGNGQLGRGYQVWLNKPGSSSSWGHAEVSEYEGRLGVKFDLSSVPLDKALAIARILAA